MQSKIISFEGLDASGKGTQSKLLHRYLMTKDMRSYLISFPMYNHVSSTPTQMFLHGDLPELTDPFAISTLFAQDRLVSYYNVWKEEYDKGIVICDRYTESNGVYQSARYRLNNDNFEKSFDLYEQIICYEYNKLNLPKSDLIIYLKVPLEIAISNIDKRADGKVLDDNEKNKELLNYVYKFSNFISRYHEWEVINCADKDGNMRSIEDIHEEIKAVVDKYLDRWSKLDD